MITVKESINKLQKVDQNLPVILTHTDHTDFTYTWELRLDDIKVEKDIYIEFNDEGEEVDYKKGVVISCTPWEEDID